ncbi:MAG: hypothetical protein ACE5QW_06605, partial [Thermoplasmata archaeon]
RKSKVHYVAGDLNNPLELHEKCGFNECSGMVHYAKAGYRQMTRAIWLRYASPKLLSLLRLCIHRNY